MVERDLVASARGVVEPPRAVHLARDDADRHGVRAGRARRHPGFADGGWCPRSDRATAAVLARRHKKCRRGPTCSPCSSRALCGRALSGEQVRARAPAPMAVTLRDARRPEARDLLRHRAAHELQLRRCARATTTRARCSTATCAASWCRAATRPARARAARASGAARSTTSSTRTTATTGAACSAWRTRAPTRTALEFFITYDKQPHLNNKYTVFGRVIDGHETLDAMEKIPVGKKDRPLTDRPDGDERGARTSRRLGGGTLVSRVRRRHAHRVRRTTSRRRGGSSCVATGWA